MLHDLSLGWRTETIAEVSPDAGSFPVKVVWRLGSLVAIALAMVLLT